MAEVAYLSATSKIGKRFRGGAEVAQLSVGNAKSANDSLVSQQAYLSAWGGGGGRIPKRVRGGVRVLLGENAKTYKRFRGGAESAYLSEKRKIRNRFLGWGRKSLICRRKTQNRQTTPRSGRRRFVFGEKTKNPHTIPPVEIIVTGNSSIIKRLSPMI